MGECVCARLHALHFAVYIQYVCGFIWANNSFIADSQRRFQCCSASRLLCSDLKTAVKPKYFTTQSEPYSLKGVKHVSACQNRYAAAALFNGFNARRLQELSCWTSAAPLYLWAFNVILWAANCFRNTILNQGDGVKIVSQDLEYEIHKVYNRIPPKTENTLEARECKYNI